MRTAPNAPLRELGLDSLSHFKFLVELEKRFGLTLEDADFSFSKTATIAGIKEVLARYMPPMRGTAHE